MNRKKTVLLVSPYASRLGHGAFHAQRTLAAFTRAGEWCPILLTGRGFSQRVRGEPLHGDVVEMPVDYSLVDTYGNALEAVRWGLRRARLERALLRGVDALLKERSIDAVLFLDGDVSAIYECWARNSERWPGVGWVVAHSATDFYLSEMSVRSLYKWWLAPRVAALTEKAGATILYCTADMRDDFCTRLHVSEQARRRIVLSSFGSDEDDMRLPKDLARRELHMPTDAKVALFFGLLRRDKRPDVAIRSVAGAPDDWWLLLAGEPYSYRRQTIERWVESAGIRQRTRSILRYLDEGEVRVVFSAADVLLVTHDRPTVSASGPLNMARSYRLPAIVGDTGSLGTWVRADGVGFLAVPGDPGSFAAQLRRFGSMSAAELAAVRQRIGEAARRHSFDSVVAHYSRALEIATSFARSYW